MIKQNMIDKIYETIADKTLNFGCQIMQCNRISTTTSVSRDEQYLFVQTDIIWAELFGKNDEWYEIFWYKNLWFEVVENVWIDEIIWHPVLIWDVLDYLQSNNFLSECIEILWVRNNKRKPIQDQSEHCVKYVYDLIQTIK